MSHDLFISYAHQGDNTSCAAVAALVARLHAELKDDFSKRFNRDLEIFFDKEDIKDFDHWQVRCHRALRDSRFFIVCLSRTYLRSDACRWEWEEWCRHELEHGLVGQGAASLWFLKLEDLDVMGVRSQHKTFFPSYPLSSSATHYPQSPTPPTAAQPPNSRRRI